MISFPAIGELELVAFYDAGVPNSERVALLVREEVNLAKYALVACWKNPQGNVSPLNELFWLGDRIITAGTLLYVYTGSGSEQFGVNPDGRAYVVLHMGRPMTIYNRPEIVPVLIRFDALTIGRHFDMKTMQFSDEGKMLPGGQRIPLP